MMSYIRDHKLISGIVIFLLIVIIAAIVSLLMRGNQPLITPAPAPSQETPAVSVVEQPTATINNWSDTVKNLSDGEQDQVQSTLYDTLKLNLPAVPEDISPEIRAGSYHQTYDPDTQIYITEFLVDIPSIQQTYRVVDQYSELPPLESGLLDYATMVFCPTDAEIIWEAFSCTDFYKIEQGG